MPGPGDDGVEDGCGAVDGGEFVVAGGQAARLLEVTEAAFDDIAVAVVGGVEAGWPATAGAAAQPMADLMVAG